MSKMRAKVRVSSVFPYRHPESGEQLNETLRFSGVARSGGYPADGSDENNTFAKFSPSVSIEIIVANPALFGKFEPGKEYYLDFVPVEAGAEA